MTRITPITFAHRGARADEPENTLAAFRRALELGAAGLESDAWLSSDGQVVLVHDDVFRRGLRRIRVARTPADRLARHGVPRLVDLYDELGTDFELSIDVKNRDAAAPILELAAPREAAERLWLCSPGVRFLRALRDRGGAGANLVHSTSRRHLPEPLERHAAQLADAGIAAVNLHHSEWTEGLVTLFHRFGVQTFAWDVQEVRHIRAAIEMGIDAIYCDHVNRMVATVAEFARDDR
ncbi:MAG TPA: glycerophosphodiester phosphodiesterase [Acidimicrobiia bacterium]|nr:glycerophosphodiester phosphodiesterase [Acidimicrobiia bacterium]